MAKSPDAFRTISEVADDLDLPQHVLRFWETRFTQIKPMKRGGGRRYYRPDDVNLLKGIRHLLYGQGYTIKGVQRILKEQGVRHVSAIWLGDEEAEELPGGSDTDAQPLPLEGEAAPSPKLAAAPKTALPDPVDENISAPSLPVENVTTTPTANPFLTAPTQPAASAAPAPEATAPIPQTVPDPVAAGVPVPQPVITPLTQPSASGVVPQQATISQASPTPTVGFIPPVASVKAEPQAEKAPVISAITDAPEEMIQPPGFRFSISHAVPEHLVDVVNAKGGEGPKPASPAKKPASKIPNVLFREPMVEAEQEFDDNAIVGQSTSLDKEGHKALEGVLADLLDCKRLLDQVR